MYKDTKGLINSRKRTPKDLHKTEIRATRGAKSAPNNTVEVFWIKTPKIPR